MTSANHVLWAPPPPPEAPPPTGCAIPPLSPLLKAAGRSQDTFNGNLFAPCMPQPPCGDWQGHDSDVDVLHALRSLDANVIRLLSKLDKKMLLNGAKDALAAEPQSGIEFNHVVPGVCRGNGDVVVRTPAATMAYCPHCAVLAQQVQALAQALAGLGPRVFSWALNRGTSLVERSSLLDMLLRYMCPVEHVDDRIASACISLQSQRGAASSPRGNIENPADTRIDRITPSEEDFRRDPEQQHQAQHHTSQPQRWQHDWQRRQYNQQDETPQRQDRQQNPQQNQRSQSHQQQRPHSRKVSSSSAGVASDLSLDPREPQPSGDTDGEHPHLTGTRLLSRIIGENAGLDRMGRAESLTVSGAVTEEQLQKRLSDAVKLGASHDEIQAIFDALEALRTTRESRKVPNPVVDNAQSRPGDQQARAPHSSDAKCSSTDHTGKSKWHQEPARTMATPQSLQALRLQLISCTGLRPVSNAAFLVVRVVGPGDQVKHDKRTYQKRLSTDGRLEITEEVVVRANWRDTLLLEVWAAELDDVASDLGVMCLADMDIVPRMLGMVQKVKLKTRAGALAGTLTVELQEADEEDADTDESVWATDDTSPDYDSSRDGMGTRHRPLQ